MLVFRDDFEARALDRLISQDVARARVQAYVAALAAGGRVLEALIYAVFFGLQLDLATGVHLDRWGRLLGELRGGLTETRYRAWIDHRIYVQSEDATVPKMLALLVQIFGPRTARAVLMLPNGCKFYVEGGSAFVDDIERAHADQLFRDYAPAGACWPVIEALEGGYTFTTPFDEIDGHLIASTIYGGR